MSIHKDRESRADSPIARGTRLARNAADLHPFLHPRALCLARDHVGPAVGGIQLSRWREFRGGRNSWGVVSQKCFLLNRRNCFVFWCVCIFCLGGSACDATVERRLSGGARGSRMTKAIMMGGRVGGCMLLLCVLRLGVLVMQCCLFACL